MWFDVIQIRFSAQHSPAREEHPRGRCAACAPEEHRDCRGGTAARRDGVRVFTCACPCPVPIQGRGGKVQAGSFLGSGWFLQSGVVSSRRVVELARAPIGVSRHTCGPVPHKGISRQRAPGLTPAVRWLIVPAYSFGQARTPKLSPLVVRRKNDGRSYGLRNAAQ